MNGLVFAIDAIIGVLRPALLVVAVGVVALAGLAHAVRTRRLSPFGAIGRFVRGTVDPLFVPVQRRLLRAGGSPATAPWWTVALVVVGGIVLLSLLGFVRGQLIGAMQAADMGARGILRLLVSWMFAVLQIALMVRVISSWIQVSPYSPWIRWSMTLTDWLIRPLRQLVPSFGMIDITPIVAYLVLWVLEKLVLGVI